MKIGILGSGDVGVALAKAFMTEGHEVIVATREPDGEKGVGLRAQIPGATVTNFASAAQAAELAIFCVKWDGAEETIGLIQPENLAGKIVIDTSNYMKMQGDAMVYGGSPDSAAEQLQAWLPDSHVVKGFNTMPAMLMYKPQLSATPTMFLAGDDADAKQQVMDIVTTFGWEPLDAGGLISARDIEAMAVLMIRYNMANNDWNHTFKYL